MSSPRQMVSRLVSPPPWAASAYSNIATAESRALNSYADLATVQAVSLITGTRALVEMFCQVYNAGAAAQGPAFAVAVSGATTVAAPAGYSEVRITSYGGNQNNPIGQVVVLDGLTPGLNTFTLKFRSYDNVTTEVFSNRTLRVTDLGSV